MSVLANGIGVEKKAFENDRTELKWSMGSYKTQDTRPRTQDIGHKSLFVSLGLG
jgi:hypothetical protein